MNHSIGFLAPRPASQTVFIKILMNDLTTYHLNIHFPPNNPKAVITTGQAGSASRLRAQWLILHYVYCGPICPVRQAIISPWGRNERLGWWSQHTWGETCVRSWKVFPDPFKVKQEKKPRVCIWKEKKREKKKEFSSWQIKKSGFYSAHWLRVSLIKTNCLILTGPKPVLLLALAPHLSGKKRGKSALAVPRGRLLAPVFRFLAQAAFPALWEVRGPAWRWHSRSDLSLVTAPPHHWHSSLEKATLRALAFKSCHTLVFLKNKDYAFT